MRIVVVVRAHMIPERSIGSVSESLSRPRNQSRRTLEVPPGSTHSILAMKDSDLDWMKPGAAAAEAAKKRSSDCESETTVAVENAIDFVNRHRRASALTDQYVGVCSRPLPESQVTIH